ncbi:PDR/VanB family oxidoreductase [Ramlibacter solisilvae]|uniref:Vanillate O-demethylase oxidoreductase n=1 Tax=Ramlibacter tataouinensis TaxID=94132 RepID=A0A127JXK4_9BURK|nr:PDR/VanB family oxidoreductase [Ramlibacter tataouinensis]AMO24629.1 Vanillate O-demethylase oxidoreductase [Ramlibacter tataouinensis]
MSTIEVKVLRKAPEAEGIASYELARPDGRPLPAFSAGSHVDVHLPGGITRQYSLCNRHAEAQVYRIAVLRDANSRGGSAAMHERIHEGDLLQISEPRNHFPLVHAVRTVLLAGGIGITPLLCMAHRLQAVGADFELHYCTRSQARTAFAAEIAASPFASRVRFHFDDGPPAQKLDLAQAIGRTDAQTHLYVCGPAGFIQHVTEGARQLGWPGAQVHVEYFAGAAQDNSGDRAFEVKIASSGQLVRVAPQQTVVQALAEAGLQVLTSCEQGVCGTCITRVLEGECDHRDMYFTDEEKARHDQFTPCCSRARSPVLVLDL